MRWTRWQTNSGTAAMRLPRFSSHRRQNDQVIHRRIPGGRRVSVGILAAAASLGLLVSACGTSDGDDTTTSSSSTTTGGSTSGSSDTATGATGVDASLFAEGALVGDIQTVDCTLENGTETSCHQLTVPSQPATVQTGPFCPSSLDDPDYGTTVWDGEQPGFYGLDRPFWEMVDGEGYSFANEDGSINVADPGDSGTQPSGSDTCLQATPDDSFTLQVLLPVEPEFLDTPTDLGTVSQVGLAVDGVTIFGDAPSGASGAIPALDHCGGHDDPSGYYHWHFGSTSIQTNLNDAGIGVTCSVAQDAEALFGVAFDGYPIYGPLEDGEQPDDLDECNGHIGSTPQFGETYHYHLTYDDPNLPPCRVGAVANDKLTSPDNPDAQLPDTGGPGGGGGGGPPGGGAGPG